MNRDGIGALSVQSVGIVGTMAHTQGSSALLRSVERDRCYRPQDDEHAESVGIGALIPPGECRPLLLPSLNAHSGFCGGGTPWHLTTPAPQNSGTRGAGTLREKFFNSRNVFLFFRGIPLFIVCVMFCGTQGVVCGGIRIGLCCGFVKIFFMERGNGVYGSEEHG